MWGVENPRGGFPMKCDLCRHEKTLPGQLLCEPCTEMVQRLIVVDERIRTAEEAEEDRFVNASAAAAGSLG
jgi:hypothetical protein